MAYYIDDGSTYRYYLRAYELFNRLFRKVLYELNKLRYFGVGL